MSEQSSPAPAPFRPTFRTANPEIHRASTVLFGSMAELDAANAAVERGERGATTYGTLGTPTTDALERILLDGEGGAGVALSSSGLAAITVAVLAVLRAGDHFLVTDAAYGPLRRLCDRLLPRLGVETEFYDPLIGGAIEALVRPTTRAIWLESPGTHTFEVQDVPSIVAAARRASEGRPADRRIVTIADNTYGSPGLLAPIALGVDISVVALTKYWGGHSDVLMGATFGNADVFPAIREAARETGACVSGEDAYLVIRGSRTVRERMRAHEAAALEIAARLAAHPRVGRVLHPALPDTPGHEQFRRDFAGSNGLFAFELLDAAGDPAGRAEGDALIDRIVAGGHVGLGYSWGGFESLVVPGRLTRTVRRWEGGALTRLHVGLEPVETIWADLARALDG